MLQLTSRRFLRELDEAPEENNLQYILKCPCIPFFDNQGLHNKIMLGDNGGHSGVMCERSPYIDWFKVLFNCWEVTWDWNVVSVNEYTSSICINEFHS